MRDILNTFGSIKTAASAALTAFPYGVDSGAPNTLGYVDSVYIRVVIDTKAPASTETLTIKVFDCDTENGTPVELDSKPFAPKAWQIGDELLLKIPVEHKRYISLSGAASASSGVGLTAFLERG